MQHSLRRSASGHVADLLHFPQSPPSASPPSTVILFIPGNPGLPQYYAPFLSSLQAALPPSSSSVYALGHLGHSNSAPRIWSSQGVVGLKGQVDQKVQFVDDLREKYGLGVEGGPRLVLIGHSMGAWVICEVSTTSGNVESRMSGHSKQLPAQALLRRRRTAAKPTPVASPPLATQTPTNSPFLADA